MLTERGARQSLRSAKRRRITSCVMNERPVVGVDIGGTKMCLYANAEGRAHCEVDSYRRRGGRGRAFRTYRCFRAAASRTAGRDRDCGSGTGRKRQGSCFGCPSSDHRLVAGGSQSSDCLVVVLNDAEAALLEATADMAPGSTAIVVMAGTGIGAALLLDGMPFRGARGWAGELGSMPVGDPPLPLDRIASGAALLRALGGDASRAAHQLSLGESSARAAVARAGEALGLGLATLINLLNPSRLLLAGGTLRFPGYADAAIQATRRLALPQLAEFCKIELAADADTLVARGAARRAAAELKRWSSVVNA